MEIAVIVLAVVVAVVVAVSKKEVVVEKTAEEKTAEEKTAERIAVIKIVEAAKEEIAACKFRKEAEAVYFAATNKAWEVTNDKEILSLTYPLFNQAFNKPQCVNEHVEVATVTTWCTVCEDGSVTTNTSNINFFIDGKEAFDAIKINEAMKSATYTRVHQFADFKLVVIKTHD